MEDNHTADGGAAEPPARQNNSGDHVTRITVVIGYLMLFVSAVCVSSIPIIIWFTDTNAIRPLAEDEAVFTWLMFNFYRPIFILLAAATSGIIGTSMVRLARASVTEVIPDKDRKLLEPLIAEGKSDAVNLYTELSSLKGITGFFTHLGITGLPLATIAITLVFTFLAVWNTDAEGNLNEGLLDLTKLTLGAFIGSFVQRTGSSAAARFKEHSNAFGRPSHQPAKKVETSSNDDGDSNGTSESKSDD